MNQLLTTTEMNTHMANLWALCWWRVDTFCDNLFIAFQIEEDEPLRKEFQDVIPELLLTHVKTNSCR